jgi:sugar lactone lactonase YvrE
MLFYSLTREKFFSVFAILIVFSFFFASSPDAAEMPVYERLQPVTDFLNTPSAVAVDADENLYVTDVMKGSLNVFNENGDLLRRLKELDEPISVAVKNNNMILVGNKGTGNVEAYDASLSLLFKLGSGDGEFTLPGAIEFDSSGKIYVADCKEDKIKVYHPDGSFDFSFGTSGSGDGEFHFPTSVTINENTGEILVSDRQVKNDEFFGEYHGARIQVFYMDGRFKDVFDKYGVLIRPMGTEVDIENRIYITDTFQNGVQVFDSDGTYRGAIFDSDNQMRTPLGIAISNSNRMYVASQNTGSVEVYQLEIPIPDIAVSPDSHDFGEVHAGTSESVTHCRITGFT